jgi:hypothetical protein
MEVYRNEVEELRHYVVVAGSITTADSMVWVRIYDPLGVEVFSDEATLVSPSDSVPYYKSLVGTDITNLGSDHVIEWAYTVQGLSVVKRESLEIVSPYISLARLKTMPSLGNYSSAVLRGMERLVADVINVYANQTFSLSTEPAIVLGQNSDNLPLPNRLVELAGVDVMDDTLDATGQPIPYSILEYVTFDPDDRWHVRRRTTWPVDRTTNPVSNYRLFKYPKRYRVSGTWGWEFVPKEVTRAAELLVNDYFCADAKYREKYLDNIRAGNWRMEFRVTGDETTGNANADMLLSGFRNLAPAVI